jgi:hypothetical protein
LALFFEGEFALFIVIFILAATTIFTALLGEDVSELKIVYMRLAMCSVEL